MVVEVVVVVVACCGVAVVTSSVRDVTVGVGSVIVVVIAATMVPARVVVLSGGLRGAMV